MKTVTINNMVCEIEKTVVNALCDVLRIDKSDVEYDRPFSEYGVDSLLGVDLVNMINTSLGIDMKTIVIFDYTSVTELTEFIEKTYGNTTNLSPGEMQEVNEDPETDTDDIFEKSVDNDISVEPESKEENDTGSLNNHIIGVITSSLCSVLQVEETDIDPERPFSEYGVDSLLGVDLVNMINTSLGIDMKTIVVFDYSTVADLSTFIEETYESEIGLPHRPAPEIRDIPKHIPVMNNKNRKITEKNAGAIAKAAPVKKNFYRAVQLSRPCRIDDITIEQYPLTEPGDDQVQVLVKAASLNFGDLLSIRGLYPNMPDYPFTPGSEISGVVIKTGKNVKEYSSGDEVFGLASPSQGGHGTVVNTNAAFIVKKPAHVSHEEAAAFPVVFMTMHYLFQKAQVEEGETVLIQTAAGGTGLISVQLAKLAGAEIFATAGSEHKLDYLRDMGVSNLINYREVDFKEEVLKRTRNRGVDVVINTLSGDAMQKGIEILAPGGRYLDIAMTGMKSANKIDLSSMVDNQSFYSIDLVRFLKSERVKAETLFMSMVSYLEQGLVKPTIGKVFPFQQVTEAYRYMENRANIGKIIVTMKDEVHQPDLLSENAVKASVEKGENADALTGRITGQRNIAIIGMSARLPGAENVQQFWKNISNGKSAISGIPMKRWNITDDHPQLDSLYKYGGFLDDIEDFDPLFFKISPNEAEVMDPQQRLFLMESWKALEDAGYSDVDLKGKKCGMFVGCGDSGYGELLARSNSSVNAYSFQGNVCSILSARLSYFLDLRGPSIAVETACSSSLVAIHLACESIESGTSEIALAGGVFLYSTPSFFFQFGQLGMLSKDGQCKTFDNDADGFVSGEGVGVVCLKPLEAALADGDIIYGVIKGSGINQDGKTNGITAPSALSQTELECGVYDTFNINPETISYIEAHGTGTKLGDPIEIAALTDAFSRYTKKKQFCLIGSVKTNIGHTVSAAGVSGLIKVLLCLKNRKIAPSLNCNNENKYINFADSPVKVNKVLAEWERTGDNPRRAAVSSFGFSGTNAHIILDEAPHRPRKTPGKMPFYIIPLSAKTEQAVHRKIDDLRNWLSENKETVFIGDISYMHCAGRSHFNCRTGFIVKDLDDLQRQLDEAVLNKEDAPDINDVKIKGTKSARSFDDKCDTITGKLTGGDLYTEEYREYLRQLLDIYMQGQLVNWKKLFKHMDCMKISIPVYPFEKEKYWTTTDEENCQKEDNITLLPNETVEAGPPCIHKVLSKEWTECALPLAENNSITEKTIFLVNREVQPLAEELARLVTDGGYAIIRKGTAMKSDGNCLIDIDFEDPLHGIRAWEEIRKDGTPGCLIDLSDLYSKRTEPAAMNLGKLTLLQSLVKDLEGSELKCIHVTRGLQTFGTADTTLAGADFAGLVKMIGAEYGKVYAVTIDVDNKLNDSVSIKKAVLSELSSSFDAGEVCYRKGKRFVPALVESFSGSIETKKESFARKSKVVAITGGTRGLGAEVARHLVSQGIKKLVVMGVNPLPPREEWHRYLQKNSDGPDLEKIRNIISLEEAGATVRIYTGPLNKIKELTRFFKTIRKELGEIGGVVHCAGRVMFNNPAFINKEMDDMNSVFDPKIEALQTLHQVFEKDNLDFFVLFSSVSSIVPSLAASQLEYSLANSYMNYFAEYQNSKGNTSYKSILWPSWKEAGIGELKSAGYKRTGFTSHTTSDGLLLLDQVMSMKEVTLLPAVVNTDLFDHLSLLQISRNKTIPVQTGKTSKSERNSSSPIIAVLTWLRALFAEKIKIDEERLDFDVSFEEFGVDSVLIAELIKSIDKDIGTTLDPSLLFEYSTLDKLGSHIYENYRQALEDAGTIASIQKETGENQESDISDDKNGNCQVEEDAVEHNSSVQKVDIQTALGRKSGSATAGKVAVIGMGCNFPGAPDLDQYWKNLCEGVSSVTEVPEMRWNIDELYSPTNEQGKSLSKWGGFIDNIDCFDPEYFNIREDAAAQVDPLIRQFLEVTVQTVRHAGYEESELAKRKIGVFVGSRMGNYSMRVDKTAPEMIQGTAQNFIAAHISHYFNFKGPNLVVDTACSSSLVSIDLACKSLILGESEMAVAGGVDIILDESLYIGLSESHALSPDGKCHTFDEKANGFVPGEGCGVVILKLLDRALADGDTIYSVIESTAVNNDGRTMGMTTPNPEAQREVIADAIEKTAVSPADISYIETHGTGTMIGDPIELQALNKLFRKSTEMKEYCAVGSVKTNVGHLLSAAGVASFIKVVLCLHNRMLVPTLHCEKPNPRFKFEDSPFYPNRELKQWEPVNGKRYAGISSFGFGGTNAHILVGEGPNREHEWYRKKRGPLPLYRFNKRRFWLEKEGNNTTSQDWYENDESGEDGVPKIDGSLIEIIDTSYTVNHPTEANEPGKEGE